ncbi:hypothetical protein [Fulvimonas soli]|uniref:Thioredoxin-like protein n=1 Tax=Fulvimonas soli TaxID=155197 RepID=A0A316IF52_9GAMM|nr:hypothetical protein [Fulvimonas soli]PWK92032.1 hypothetical protein C7456_103151 [Fulvimonas soli]TNY25784.1 hypothetical protein BV497_12140 [Fulvimonas soli]
MNPLTPLFAALLAAAAAAPAAGPAIRSQAELDRYLRDTPLERTPLAPLSPGGRRRFLAELGWGRGGLGSVPFDDIDNELTHAQAVRLLALFDAQAYARGLGLAPAERARRETERAEDARARGCAAGSCPESAIEQRFDALVLQRPDPAMPDAGRRAAIGRRYDRLFAGLQHPASLRQVSKPDLRLLKRAAERAAAEAPDAARIADLRADLAELQRRRMIGDGDYAGLYRVLVASRRLDEATALARQRPGMQVDAVPAMPPTPAPPQGQPTALRVDASGRHMRRQAFDLSGPWRIVVVAACHFSEDAARDIVADARLRPLFAERAIWLASQGTSFAAAAEWNRRFPDQPINIAWQDSEWPMLDDWGMPTFYVFRQGRLVDRWSGHDMDLLRAHLRRDGLLR